LLQMDRLMNFRRAHKAFLQVDRRVFIQGLL
jgi:hypothetical protein